MQEGFQTNTTNPSVNVLFCEDKIDGVAYFHTPNTFIKVIQSFWEGKRLVNRQKEFQTDSFLAFHPSRRHPAVQDTFHYYNRGQKQTVYEENHILITWHHSFRRVSPWSVVSRSSLWQEHTAKQNHSPSGWEVRVRGENWVSLPPLRPCSQKPKGLPWGILTLPLPPNTTSLEITFLSHRILGDV